MNIENFVSPPWEYSLYKKIPMNEYNRKTMKAIREMVGKPLRVRFRGPRPDYPGRLPFNRQSTCLKQDAVTFAVYCR
jgi:hypothetical protein